MSVRNFKGTRDYLPNEMILRNQIIEKIKKRYEGYGFVPLETPAIEYLDILLNKYGGEADRLIYRLEYKGGAVAGLKYDLTVPLSRFWNQNKDILQKPFRRYQIQPVWRADRPQPNQGRFREFYQCDADIVGEEDLAADAEIITMTNEVLKALDIGRYVIRLNNRKLLNGITKLSGIEEGTETIFYRTLDKLEKIGQSGVREELLSLKYKEEAIDKVFSLIKSGYTAKESNELFLKEIKGLLAGIEEGEAGITELERILSYLRLTGVDEENIRLDLSLVRGLDYYTGTVYESNSLELKNIGSLSGGGRYDNLLGGLGGEAVPSVGSTIGLDRIVSLLKQLGKIKTKNSLTKVLITLFRSDFKEDVLKLASKLRGYGINVETIYKEMKLKKQFSYADKKEISYVIVYGPDEVKSELVTLKELKSGRQNTLSIKEAIKKLLEND